MNENFENEATKLPVTAKPAHRSIGLCDSSSMYLSRNRTSVFSDS